MANVVAPGDHAPSTLKRPPNFARANCVGGRPMSPNRKYLGFGSRCTPVRNALPRSVAKMVTWRASARSRNGYSVMSAGPAPHISTPDKKAACATTTSWLPVPVEENTKYLRDTTSLEPFLAAHYISNDGAAAPKTSRRRAYTQDERRRVAYTRKVGACEGCRTRKISCSHVPLPSAAAIQDYLQKPQGHEIFALALNMQPSTAIVNVHKESMIKQIADIGDKLPKAQDDLKPSAGVASESLVGDMAVKPFTSRLPPTFRPGSSCQTPKPPAKVYNVARARSPSRTQQPGTGKFKVQIESPLANARIKRRKPDAPRTKSTTATPTNTVDALNTQAISNLAVIAHDGSSAPAHTGQINHDLRKAGHQVVVANHSQRAICNQNQQQFTREACLMQLNSAQSLLRRPSTGSERDSLDSYMGDMITSSARSASSNGDFRPLTPHEFRSFPVVETNLTLTTAAITTEYDVMENTSAQTLTPHPSDDVSFSWTGFLNGELDDEILDQDGLFDVRSNACARFPPNGSIIMLGNAGKSAVAKQYLVPPTELMDADKF